VSSTIFATALGQCSVVQFEDLDRELRFVDILCVVDLFHVDSAPGCADLGNAARTSTCCETSTVAHGHQGRPPVVLSRI
jgi:hypothetical protein